MPRPGTSGLVPADGAGSTASDPSTGADLITFEGVTKRFPDGTTAVDNLDLQIPTGKITVMVGPSGCGKTTTLRMINRMIEPTSGRILLDGENVLDAVPAQLRRRIGYVIQQAGLFPHRTILDNVATVPYLLGWDRARARSRAMELLERVGLDAALARRYPYQLSGGQQQRVGVARALAADPPVMLMDEPFSAVDPVVRKSLQEEFLRLQSELGKTIVFVTHDIDEAIALGDQVAVFTVGRVAQFAPPRDLLTRPANEFVENFLGLDRGVRHLSLFSSGQVSLRDNVLIAADAPVTEIGRLADATNDHWLLVVDAQRRPLGWVSTDLPEAYATAASCGQAQLVSHGHAFQPDTDTLRAALDSAVLSPSGRGIAVDAEGRVLGVATVADVDAAIRLAHTLGTGGQR